MILSSDSTVTLSIQTTHQTIQNTQAEIIFVCIKPQQLYNIDLSIYSTTSTCVSIMNGVNTDKLNHFKHIVRTMPNLFGEVQQGVTARYEH